MASKIIAPMVATMIVQMNPPLPIPRMFWVMKPPTKAPAIPMRIVTMIPPGSSPGMISLPKAPAIRPIMIQTMMPVIIFFSLRSLSAALCLSARKAGYRLGYAHELVLGQLPYRVDAQSVLERLGVVLAEPLNSVYRRLCELCELLL